jgi:hydroxymethylpyrimidine pyrophosphatase-like HAD family hydrolase
MNDIDLLAAADVGIAMASAPDELKKIAKLVASPTGEDPIIDALGKAIQMAEHKRG